MALSRIIEYSVASTDEAAFIIGGYSSPMSARLDLIAQFKDETWALYGNLRKGRSDHRSITFDGKTMVIGGRRTDGNS